MVLTHCQNLRLLTWVTSWKLVFFFHCIFPHDHLSPNATLGGGRSVDDYTTAASSHTLFKTLHNASRVELAENLSQRRPRRLLPLVDLALDLILTLGQLLRHNLLRHLAPWTSTCLSHHSRVFVCVCSDSDRREAPPQNWVSSMRCVQISGTCSLYYTDGGSGDRLETVSSSRRRGGKAV